MSSRNRAAVSGICLRLGRVVMAGLDPAIQLRALELLLALRTTH